MTATNVADRDELELFAASGRIAIAVAGGLFFFALGIGGEFIDEFRFRFVFGPCFIAFGVFVPAGAGRLIARRATPAIVFDRAGLRFGTGGGLRTPAWSDLEAACIVSAGGPKLVALRPVDPEGYIERSTARAIDRTTMRMDLDSIAAPIKLPASTGLDAEALLAVVARYAPHAVV